MKRTSIVLNDYTEKADITLEIERSKNGFTNARQITKRYYTLQLQKETSFGGSRYLLLPKCDEPYRVSFNWNLKVKTPMTERKNKRNALYYETIKRNSIKRTYEVAYILIDPIENKIRATYQPSNTLRQYGTIAELTMPKSILKQFNKVLDQIKTFYPKAKTILNDRAIQIGRIGL